MKNLKLSKVVFFSIFPLLSIPGLLYGIYRKSRWDLAFFAIALGLMSYIYIPIWGNDISEHYLEFDSYSGLGWREFLIQIELRPDFFFYFLMYLYNKIGLSAQALWFTISLTTSGTIFYLFNDLVSKRNFSNKLYFLSFLFVLFSISYPQFFSNIRFYFGSSFLLMGYHFGVIKKKRLMGSGFVFLSLLTHFSLLSFLPVYLLVSIYPKKNLIYKVLFLSSFFFLLVTKDFIVELLDILGITDRFESKVHSYTQYEDLVERAKAESLSGYILYAIKTAWVYVAYAYLLLTIKRNSLYRNILFSTFFIANISYQLPFPFFRYTLFVKMFLVFVVLEESFVRREKLAFYVFGILFVMSCIVDFITMRVNLIESYLNLSATNIISILITEINQSSFLGIKQ